MTLAMDPVTNTGGLTAPAGTAGARDTVKLAGTTAKVPSSPVFHDDLARAAERLQPVAGRAYSKVMAGAREGEYVNTSGNKRDGQAFALEHHGGRRWHVYGTGADRVVVAFPKATTPPVVPGCASPAVTAPAVSAPAVSGGAGPADAADTDR
jgi:hypothetical protein